MLLTVQLVQKDMLSSSPAKHGGKRLSKSLSPSNYDERFDKSYTKDALKVFNIDSFIMENAMSPRHHRLASATVSPPVCYKHFLAAEATL